MYKLFLTLRYLRKRRIAIFAVVSVWLCVAMVLVVISVMGGFLDILKERSRGLLSDIVIDNATLQGFPFYQEFIDHLRGALPDEIVAATPVIYNYGLLRVRETSFTKPVRVVGIRLKEYQQVNDFKNSLYYDKYYSGTTNLQPQWQPVAGYDDNGLLALPSDHQESLAKWLAEHPKSKEPEEWPRIPGQQKPWPGVFQQTFEGPPGYYGEDNGGRAPGIIVGCNILNERTKTGKLERVYPRGAKLVLTLMPLTRGGRLSGEGATSLVMRLADDSRTRVHEIDELCCYVDFDLVQTSLAMEAQELEGGSFTPPRASQILVCLAEGLDIIEGRQHVEDQWERFLDTLDPLSLSPVDAQLLGFVKVETWEERQRPFIAAVEKEKILVTILFSLISLVAIVLIGCIFWMIVTQKTRDIGVIKSIGASPGGIAAIFVAFGAAVGVLGSALGVATGTVFVWYINDFQEALVRLHPQLRVWSPDVYTFDLIPNVVKPDEAVAIMVVAVLASILGALIPAVLAARVWPAKALRYE